MIPMNDKLSNWNKDIEPFIWLFRETSPKESSSSFHYDESLDLNLNTKNEPCILVDPFFAGTHTKTEVSDERDDSDE